MAEKPVMTLREACGNVEFEWDIQNFLSLTHKTGEYLKSPSFLLSDESWCLWIYPRGDARQKSRKWISLFLCRSNNPGLHTVSYFLGIKANGSVLKDSKLEGTIDVKHSGIGSEQFVLRSTLSERVRQKGVSKGGIVTVICRAHLTGGQSQNATSRTSEPKALSREATSQTCQLNGFANLSKHFENLFLGMCDTDVKLNVQGQEFHAHRTVLRARSPVFDSMFQHEMAESIDIPDLDPELLKEFLLFLYTGRFDGITSKNALGLYKYADKYDLNDLKNECSMQIATGLSLNSILDVILLAATHREEELLINATDYFIKNADKILPTEKWKIFFIDNAMLANELLIKMVKNFHITAPQL